jgi:hypothetical protein
LHAFADAKMEKGQGEWRIMVQIGCCRCPLLGKQDAASSSSCAGSGPARCQSAGASSSAFRAQFTAGREHVAGQGPI